MRLAGPILASYKTPDEWVGCIRAAGYSAANVPLEDDISDSDMRDYKMAAQRAGIVIAEKGAWSNPIDCDPLKAREALSKCQRCLYVAEEFEARCCVNIAGSRNPSQWDGPHPDNFKKETFDMIVETTRKIIDAVKPKRTFYALETMPWIFPSSPDEYHDLLKAIDRPAFAIHFDPVNIINSPARYYDTGSLIHEFFSKLGCYIKSCHAKDVILRGSLTMTLNECRPGTGALDYATFLRELNQLDVNIPLFIEHLEPKEYPSAAEYIRLVASQNNIKLL